MQPDELTLELPTLRLAAKAWGPRDGAPVLAMHGWMDNAASFDRLAPLLDGLHIVALDLAGHGRSEWRPAGVSYQFLDWVVDARDAADALGWQRFAVLGHSLGAGLGVALAGTWPDRVTRLALVDGFTPRTQEADEVAGRLAEYVARRDQARDQGVRRFVDCDQAARRLTETLHLDVEVSRLLAARGTTALDGDAVTWARDPRITVGPTARLTAAHMRAFLTRIGCPAMLVRPRQGWPIPADRVAEVRELLAGVRIAEVDGGHHVHLERPDAVAALVGPFLRGTQEPGVG